MSRGARSGSTRRSLALVIGTTIVLLGPQIAFASPGSQLWATRYNGPGNTNDNADDLGVSPDGSVVFVTGGSYRSNGVPDYATIAYDASTGSQLWVSRYNGPANAGDFAGDLRVSPDGSTVYVTGYSNRSSGYPDYATVAYDASTGSQLWVTRYNGSKFGDFAHDL